MGAPPSYHRCPVKPVHCLAMSAQIARRYRLTGHVQGVGFRPFVYRLARGLGLTGWVRNAVGVVEVHAEGPADSLDRFARDVIASAPAIARPCLADSQPVPTEGHPDFSIHASLSGATPDIHVPPDYFTCPDCLRELADPGDRRQGYPFINCTQCGPRYTLITALPYDRPNTTMAGFPLCPACQAEYEDPTDRRFHAEPVACPVCGPHLTFRAGARVITGPDPACLAAAVAVLRDGGLLAVKGVGGYHLMADATQADAVATLRARKPRPSKPLAVMFPADGRALAASVELSPEAQARLTSPARPILLLPLRASHGLAKNLAPGLGELGCFLPYSPLHHLLLNTFGGPLVATSGNLGGEPVLTEAAEAEARLGPIVDAFLHHDRPIARPADDPVERGIAGQFRPLRLGRGTAPLELALPRALPGPVLALGSHMKNTVCLAWERRAVISPHIGELDNARGLDTLAQVADDLQRLYQVRAECLLVDRHPGYGYRSWVRASGLPFVEVWHHHAHASALAGEHPEVAEWGIFTWDGVGLGEDGTLWGGELLAGRPGHWRRFASLRPFRLPGGDQAGREPWRAAAALLWETGQTADFAPDLLHQAWQRGLNSPMTSAAGRLFDAAAALIGICRQAGYEGEGPMRLEALASSVAHAPVWTALPLSRDDQAIWRADWAPLLTRLTDADTPSALRAHAFHACLADTLVAQAEALRAARGCKDIGLVGGVFQNRLLSELARDRLVAAGFHVHLPNRVPANDAGVSFGQVIDHLNRHA